MSTALQRICALLPAAALSGCGADESDQTVFLLQAPAAAHRMPAPPTQPAWPDTLDGDWRVIEWVPARIGAWTFEEGNALVGQVAQLQTNEIEVPGYACERPSFEVSDTGRFWELFGKCQSYQPSLDCRDIWWNGRAMLNCAGSDSGLPALPEITAICPDGEGLPFTFSQLSGSRAFLGLPDGRGSLCLELVE